MASSVTQIPASRNLFTSNPITAVRKRRVAAYARVSTDSDEQATSYEAQVDYYTTYIHSRHDWEFVNIYADEGISGLNTRHREGFNSMIADALDGKIDLIITKSVSRFARNTVDSLTTVRTLKEHGVEVYFEKENIWTFDGKGELLITIMSSLAQEESRSISENVTWGQRKRFSDGKVAMPYKHFLGYDKGADGKPAINEEEALVVRLIYRLFIEGKTPNAIAIMLTESGISTPAGKKKWSDSTVLSILTNEKYKGEALLQKTFCADFLTKKMQKNKGEVHQWYVTESHPAIISVEEFDAVQQEIARRKELGWRYSSRGIFAGKLFCGDCGSLYGAKVWHSTDAYRCTVWQCNHKYSKKDGGGSRCLTPHFKEQEITAMFVEACAQLLGKKQSIAQRAETIIQMLTDCTEIDAAIRSEKSEIEIVSKLMQEHIHSMATKAMPEEEAKGKQSTLESRFHAAENKLQQLNQEKERRLAKSREIRRFAKGLTSEETTGWGEKEWLMLLDKATVQQDRSIDFLFKDGTNIKVRAK